MRDKVLSSLMDTIYHWNDDLLLPLSGKMISKNFTDACRLLGIEDLRFHDLRHEAATRLSEQGLTIPQMQQVTGHESWSSLQRYVDVSPRKSLLDFDEALEIARLAYSGGLYQHRR